jgi:hypothetical protein
MMNAQGRNCSFFGLLRCTRAKEIVAEPHKKSVAAGCRPLDYGRLIVVRHRSPVPRHK